MTTIPNADTDSTQAGFTGTLPGYLEWIKENLHCGSMTLSVACLDENRRPAKRLRLATGGWSDDEDLLARVRSGLLSMFWVSSHRGGLYVYELPVSALDWSTELNWLVPQGPEPIALDAAHLRAALIDIPGMYGLSDEQAAQIVELGEAAFDTALRRCADGAFWREYNRIMAAAAAQLAQEARRRMRTRDTE